MLLPVCTGKHKYRDVLRTEPNISGGAFLRESLTFSFENFLAFGKISLDKNRQKSITKVPQNSNANMTILQMQHQKKKKNSSWKKTSLKIMH